MSVLLQKIRHLLGQTPAQPPTTVGVYTLPRGGSNFISAWLHYHPQIFAVSERELDWRQPLANYWKKRSILSRHGVQDKRIQDTQCVVFNKVQRNMDLWGAQVQFPEDTHLIFYIRNPVAVFLSREAFRQKHEADRAKWAANEKNLDELLDQVCQIIDTYASLRKRYATLVLSHEYFCCQHRQVLPELYRFLQVDPAVEPDPRAFLKYWKSNGPALEESVDDKGTPWLVNPKTGERLSGYGEFNPLREIEADKIKSNDWKQAQGLEWILPRIRQRLGDAIMDYYEKGEYDKNLDLDAAAGS